MTMWNKDDQFGNFWLERHFDREKDSEKYPVHLVSLIKHHGLFVPYIVIIIRS